MAVYDTKQKKVVGWIDVTDMGFPSVRAFMDSGNYKRLPQFG